MNFAILVITILCVLSCTSNNLNVANPEIKLETIKNHMSLLASDDMKGRDTFSKEITRAEDYIIGNYAANKLKEFPKYPAYSHYFNLYKYSVNIELSEININGKRLEDVSILAEKTAELKSIEMFDVKSYSKDDNINTLFNTLSSSEKNLFIWLDKTHEGYFNRIKSYLGRGKTTYKEASNKIVILALGENTSIDTFYSKIVVDTKVTKARNTIAYIEGTDLKDEYIMFGAHHDHIGMDPSKEGDQIFNGANDNATGTTAVLALAKYYSERGDNRRSIIFSTFTAEEKGIIGSEVLANEFPIELSKVKAFVNIEMLGQETDWGKKSLFMTGNERSDLISIMNESANDSINIYIHPDPYKKMNLFYRSDNAAFAKMGVVAHSVSSTSMKIQPNTYHQLNDDLDHINYKNMRDLIEGITKLSKTLVSGEVTPKFFEKKN